MLTFDKLLINVRKLSIEDRVASFKKNIETLCHVEENGFNVKSL
jgi:hypothetical protein